MPEITYKHLNVLLTKNTFYYFKNGLILQFVAQWGEKVPIRAEGVFMGKNSENSDSSERDRETEKHNDSRRGYYIL